MYSSQKHFSFLALQIEISSNMLSTPKSCILAQSHAYLTVGQVNLTVERGCSHCKQRWEVERSATRLRICSNYYCTHHCWYSTRLGGPQCLDHLEHVHYSLCLTAINHSGQGTEHTTTSHRVTVEKNIQQCWITTLV